MTGEERKEGGSGWAGWGVCFITGDCVSWQRATRGGLVITDYTCM